MAPHGSSPLPPIYSDLEMPTAPDADPDIGLVKVPEGFFSAEHPNTRLVVNLLQQGNLVRLRVLLDNGIGSCGIFQIADRGNGKTNKSLFHRHATLYLSLMGVAVYLNQGYVVATIAKSGVDSLLRSQFATGVQSPEDILTFSAEYIAVMMENFDCLVPLLRHKFWQPYEATSLLYRRRYVQSRTPIIGYPDLLRCALLRSANFNITGFFVTFKCEPSLLSLSRLFYLGSLMVPHFEIDAARGTRGVFESTSGPRYVMPNLCSLSRWLLTLVAYHDLKGRLLGQVLAGLKECAHSGAYYSGLQDKGSLLLWLQGLVSRQQPSVGLFRRLGQVTEELLTKDNAGELRDDYGRYDSLCCIALLLSLLTRYNPDLPDALGHGGRILDAASAIAIQSGLADPLLRFAWPAQLLALGALTTPIGPGVGFNQFERLLNHLPVYARTLASTDPAMRDTGRWRAPVRRSVLKLNWDKVDQEMSGLMSGEATVQVATSSNDAASVLVSQEQAADLCQRQPGTMDYAAFYRQFELRYRMWASCPHLQDRRPPAIEFKEERLGAGLPLVPSDSSTDGSKSSAAACGRRCCP